MISDATTTTVHSGTNNSYTDTDVDNTTLEGSTITVKSSNSSTQQGSSASSNTTNGSVTSSTYTIKKDGTWSSMSVVKYTSSANTNGGTTVSNTIDRTVTTENSGTWQFTKKNKGIDEKNKESVLMATTVSKTTTVNVITNPSGTTTSVSNSTSGNNNSVAVWHLTQLKSKEMIADADLGNTSTGTNTSVFGGTTVTTTSPASTVVGKMSMTFTQ
jgi:hypothetical protein